MYFGGAIMTFALPYGAFIAAAVALFYLFRARHSAPRLRWSSATAPVTSVITREPGPAPAPAPATGVSAATAIPVPAAAASRQNAFRSSTAKRRISGAENPSRGLGGALPLSQPAT